MLAHSKIASQTLGSTVLVEIWAKITRELVLVKGTRKSLFGKSSDKTTFFLMFLSTQSDQLVDTKCSQMNSLATINATIKDV